MKLTHEKIDEINEKCQYGQGIFKEPSNIPVNVKELVIYMKWESSGKPGSCWDDENTINEEYFNPFDINNFEVLHLTLKELNKELDLNILYPIMHFEPEFDTTANGYYGDYENSSVVWIKLSDLYKVLKLD